MGGGRGDADEGVGNTLGVRAAYPCQVMMHEQGEEMKELRAGNQCLFVTSSFSISDFDRSDR